MKPILALLLAACSDPEKADTSAVDTDTEQPMGGGVVELETRDGITLVADAYPGDPGAPGIVLLHMIPPGNDRTTWPADFIDTLHAHGWSVLVVDRRGAGDSGGAAEDAYEGEKGRYDLEAAALWLRDSGAGPLAAIGASNGTTTVLDYAVWADGEGLPPLVAAGLMTGGTYTENNESFSDMPEIPTVFTFSTAERAWSADQQGGAPASWAFEEYADGDHGTRMVDAAPEVTADLDAFLALHLAGS